MPYYRTSLGAQGFRFSPGAQAALRQQQLNRRYAQQSLAYRPHRYKKYTYKGKKYVKRIL